MLRMRGGEIKIEVPVCLHFNKSSTQVTLIYFHKEPCHVHRYTIQLCNIMKKLRLQRKHKSTSTFKPTLYNLNV